MALRLPPPTEPAVAVVEASSPSPDVESDESLAELRSVASVAGVA